jgi:cation transport protein ChaC
MPTETPTPPFSRAFLGSDRLDGQIAREAPNLKLLTEAERAVSLKTTLELKPPGDVWLFAYGSLIWNPMVDTVECRNATVDGWHRAFCLTTIAGRGSAERPGIILGLDTGGRCEGVAFRIAEEKATQELALLWRREMLTGAYVPRWLPILDQGGQVFASAIAFTIDPAGEHYALGSSADYLKRTCEGLHAHGIADPGLDRLAANVAAKVSDQAPAAS